MADLDFTVNANTSAAQRNLQKLQSSVGGVEKSFGKLKTALAGLAIGSVVKGLFSLSNQLADLSATTNVSIQSLAGLGEALARNSGSFDQAGNAALKLTENIGRATQGSKSTQEAFAKLGIGLSELQSLSEEEILRKTVLGLGQVADTGTRAALTAELFGKTLKGADLAGAARDLDKMTEGQARFAQAAERAGAVNQSLQNSFRILQSEILIAIEPLARFAEVLLSNEQAIRTIIETIVSLVTVLGTMFVVTKLTTAVALFTNALSKNGSVFKSLMLMMGGGQAWGLARAGVQTLKNEWREMPYIFAKVGKGVESTSGPISKLMSLFGGLSMAFVRFLPLIGQIISGFVLLDGVVKFFSSNGEGLFSFLDRLGKRVSEFLGITYKTSKEKEKMAADEAKIARESERAAVAEQKRSVAIKENVENIARSFDLSTKGYSDQIKSLQESLALQRETIGLTQHESEVKQELFALQKEKNAEIAKLTEIYNEIRARGLAEEMKLLPQIVETMNKIEESYGRQRKEVEELVRQKQKELETEKQKQAFAEFAQSTQLDNARQLQRVQDDINKSTMTDTERKYYDIAAASRDSAKSAIDAENSRRRSLGVAKMTAEEERRYYNEATKNSQQLIDKTKEHDRVSRDFSTGWSRAYKQYAEDAGNASKHAESMFTKATQGMEDAFVNFAKTGKFEWNDFLASLAEEALRYELKGIFADIMAGKADAKSTLNQLQGAIGGKIGANKPASQGGASSGDMMQQLGGLFNNMANAKNQAPQGVIGSRPAQTNPTPPPVQPTTNNITYTINAVDAPSFKQLVAQDPAFIYAVTVQGAKTLAGRR
jgi:lambda family phage tail tape measure protein